MVHQHFEQLESNMYRTYGTQVFSGSFGHRDESRCYKMGHA